MQYQPTYRQPAPQGFLPFDTRSFAEAYPEALLQRAGVRKAQNPIASDIVSRAPTFGDIAKHFIAGSFSADELRAMPASVAIQHATRASVSYGTADFSATISTALAAATYAAFDATTAGFSRCLRSISVKNFLPQSVAAFSVSPLEKMVEHAEWPRALIASSRLIEDAGVESWGLSFTISREAMVNDSQSELALVFAALGHAAALNRSAALAAALEDTSNTSDGSPFFTGSNLITGYGSVSVGALDAACGALYASTLSAGGLSGVSPRYVIVPPQMAAGSYTAVMAAFGDTVRPDRVDVLICPHLTSATTFYACGDPGVSPALGLLHLGTSPDARTMQVEQLSGSNINIDGVRMAVRDDFRIVRMQRAAIVKVAA